MLRVAALLCGVAACDSTFSIIRLDDPVDGDVADGLPSTCWKPSETFDEDADAVPDGCDLCPADPMVSLTDLDGDGVDGICDPHPAVPNDRVIDFDGFETKRTWQPIAGTWSITGGAIATADTVVASTGLDTALAEHPTLDAVFDGTAGIGIYMFVGATRTLVACEHVMGNSPTPDRLTLKVGGGVPQTTDFDAGGGPGRIKLSMDLMNGFTCSLDRGGLRDSVTSPQTVNGTTTSAIGVISRNGVSSFGSVTLFGDLPK